MNNFKIYRILIMIVVGCSVTGNVRSQPPGFIWAKTLPGNVESIQRIILTDATGNVYISGVFFGTVDFDPGPGVVNLTPSPYGCNVYIAKYDASGNYIWVRNIPITASYGGNSMALDANGNIYITGFFTGSASDFDPGTGTAALAATGGNDVYIAKYDNNGNYLWANRIGNSGDDRGNEILITGAGNILLAGTFSLTVDFDPGPGIANLVATGASDIFFASYDPAGNFQWVRQIGGGVDEDVRDIAIDNSGNIVLTGLFANITDFDPGTNVYNMAATGGNDIFLAKYDAAGNLIWANSFGGINPDGGSSVKTDAVGNIFVSGLFMGTVDFDPGPGTTNLITTSSATYFGKYNANGNLVWIRQLPVNFYNSDIAITFFGNIFISGYYGLGYGSPIDMDPGTGVANLNVPTNLPPPTYNILGYFDPMGNYLWAGVFGRQCYCSVMGYKSSIHIDPAGFLYYAGIFNGPWGSGTVDFDPGQAVYNLTAPSSVDNVFFAKYLIGSTPLSFSLISFTVETINNTNHLQWITASELNNDYFEVERSPDGNNFQSIGWKAGILNSSHPVYYEFNDFTPMAGDNYYRLKQVDLNGNIHYSNILRAKIKVRESNCIVAEESGRFRVLCDFAGNMMLYDTKGRLIKSVQVTSNEIPLEIDLSSYAPGLYLIRYNDGSCNKNIKLIKH